MTRRLSLLGWCALLLSSAACDRNPSSQPPGEPPDTEAARFRNVAAPTAYVGDAPCAECHAKETTTYRQHSMASSFHPWTPEQRVETALPTALRNAPTGYDYSVIDSGGRLYQVESLTDSSGVRTHRLARRIDYVMGSGRLARSYFTEENGRLFQLPLTWYAEHGWDFSPGYQVNNARFDRLLPDRCIACHSSYPTPAKHLEGKYPTLRAGIGCERCHGPGALHVAERRSAVTVDSTGDRSIVNPRRLSLERRLDVCEQCHVHTAVAVLREPHTSFDFTPSQRLRDQVAYFKEAGSIDVVSHADRLRQSRCFLASANAAAPMECATCHNPHASPTTRATHNAPCLSCHTDSALTTRFAQSPSRADHARSADCVSCHMPKVQEQGVPHGTFTEHWIRVIARDAPRPTVARTTGQPIEPYFARDRDGPQAPLYQAMGKMVYATLATDRATLDSAATDLTAVLRNNGRNAQAHFLLGVAESQFGRTKGAVAALERAVRIDSTRPEALRALAQAYATDGRAADKVLSLYRRALALQPALAWIRAEYAHALHVSGDRDAAEREYRLAITEQPSLADAWLQYGILLLERARPSEAATAFREGITLNPAFASALATLAEVRSSGKKVTSVRAVASPLTGVLPSPKRTPTAVPLFALSIGADNMMQIANAPLGGYVLVSAPDGTLVLALPVGLDGTVRWDLRTGEGVPMTSGLYRVDVQGRDLMGRPVPSQPLYFGVVRTD